MHPQQRLQLLGRDLRPVGEEAISSNEYLGVGKVTEFRYGLKMAQCIRSNDFNCLGGIYDQGWGMVDGMHAVVFVDNHDNQRGHGGGGGVLTASNQIEGNPAFHNDWQYKVAVAFMLGHDYGFKRIMSSYYFQDTDQGPPGGAPASYPDICGNGWTCEHRWSSIMNMAQFKQSDWPAGHQLGCLRNNPWFRSRQCWLPGTWRSWQGLQHRPPGWGVLRHHPRLFSKDPNLRRARVFPVTR